MSRLLTVLQNRDTHRDSRIREGAISPRCISKEQMHKVMVGMEEAIPYEAIQGPITALPSVRTSSSKDAIRARDPSTFRIVSVPFARFVPFASFASFEL